MTASTRASPAPAPPADTYAFLVERFSALLDALRAERRALVAASPEGLHEVVARKETLCAEIAGSQHQLLEHLQGAPLPDSMQELRDLAQQCRAENALNGRIAQRARRTARTLLGILTGEPEADLYEKPGAAAAGAPTRRHSLGAA